MQPKRLVIKYKENLSSRCFAKKFLNNYFVNKTFATLAIKENEMIKAIFITNNGFDCEVENEKAREIEKIFESQQ